MSTLRRRLLCYFLCNTDVRAILILVLFVGIQRSAMAILDVVKVPANLPAGDYVLGFRYDCEATAQVWSNCADITLVE